MKTILSAISQQQGPGIQYGVQGGQYPWVFDREYICPVFGFEVLRVFFCEPDASGMVNMVKLDGWLGSNEALPQKCTLMINLEGNLPKYNVMDDNTGLPIKAGIDLRVKLLEYIKGKRPDMRIGYFNCVPVSYSEVPLSAATGAWARANEACRAIGDASDILFPCCYVHSVSPAMNGKPNPNYRSLTDTLTAQRQILVRAQHYWPNKTIAPIFWYWQWDDARAVRDVDGKPTTDPAFKWTPEITRRVLLPYDWLAAMLKQCDQLGIDTIAMWGEYYQPFDPSQPWLNALLRWQANNQDVRLWQNACSQ